jgi:hypothetical protein
MTHHATRLPTRRSLILHLQATTIRAPPSERPLEGANDPTDLSDDEAWRAAAQEEFNRIVEKRSAAEKADQADSTDAQIDPREERLANWLERELARDAPSSEPDPDDPRYREIREYVKKIADEMRDEPPMDREQALRELDEAMDLIESGAIPRPGQASKETDGEYTDSGNRDPDIFDAYGDEFAEIADRVLTDLARDRPDPDDAPPDSTTPYEDRETMKDSAGDNERNHDESTSLDELIERVGEVLNHPLVQSDLEALSETIRDLDKFLAEKYPSEEERAEVRREMIRYAFRDNLEVPDDDDPSTDESGSDADDPAQDEETGPTSPYEEPGTEPPTANSPGDIPPTVPPEAQTALGDPDDDPELRAMIDGIARAVIKSHEDWQKGLEEGTLGVGDAPAGVTPGYEGPDGTTIPFRSPDDVGAGELAPTGSTADDALLRAIQDQAAPHARDLEAYGGLGHPRYEPSGGLDPTTDELAAAHPGEVPFTGDGKSVIDVPIGQPKILNVDSQQATSDTDATPSDQPDTTEDTQEGRETVQEKTRIARVIDGVRGFLKRTFGDTLKGEYEDNGDGTTSFVVRDREGNIFQSTRFHVPFSQITRNRDGSTTINLGDSDTDEPSRRRDDDDPPTIIGSNDWL